MRYETKQIAVADADYLVTAVNVADGAQTLAKTELDFARNLTMALVDADSSISAGTLTVVGTDGRGDSVTEVFDIPTTGSATVTGTKMFKSVVSATVANIAGEAAGDTIALGFGSTVQVMEQAGSLGGIIIGTTAAGTITITDQDSKGTRYTIATFKASMPEGSYDFHNTSVARGLRIVLGSTSVISVSYNRSTSN